MNIEEIITDKQLDQSWGNANFGDMSKRNYLRQILLKCACNYRSGSTAEHIIYDLDLANEVGELKAKGREYLYEAFSNGSNV